MRYTNYNGAPGAVFGYERELEVDEATTPLLLR
jgi:hypothetical protein